MGYSPNHASSVGLILNLQTGLVMLQYHVVHDDLFKTVYADGADPPQEWYELFMLNCFNTPIKEDTYKPKLNDKWLIPEELQERCQDTVQQFTASSQQTK